MSSIPDIEKQINEATELLNTYKSKLEGPEGFAYEMNVISMEYQISQLQSELSLEYAKREKELLQLRLTGELVKNGQIPLILLSQVAGKLSDAIHAVSAYIKNGTNVNGRQFPVTVIRDLDLRLVGIGEGSTKIFISGKHSPDLFGKSLINESFDGIFDLIRQNDPELIYEAVDVVGIKGAEHIKNFLKELNRADVELELNWTTPKRRARSWRGNKIKIRKLVGRLERIEHHKKSLEIYGELTGVSRKGKFEILSEDGDEYEGRYPLKIYETVRRFRMGDRVWARINVNTYTNQATRRSKIKYLLDTMLFPEEREKTRTKGNK